MCSGSEACSYLRLIDFVHHSTLGLRVIKKEKKSLHPHLPQRHRHHCPLSNMAHTRQSRPDSGLGFQVKALKTSR